MWTVEHLVDEREQMVTGPKDVTDVLALAGRQPLERQHLARIESGQIAISPGPVALADTIREAVALVTPLANEHNVTLGLNADGLARDGHVHADRNRFKQVLLNLLTNAIKYNRPDGRVEISFQITQAARVRTMIADTGIGILAKLFEPFERLGAKQTDVEGTGLGLALAKGLTEAMGGTIEVESTVGVGTMFTIELAAAERPAGQDHPSLGDQQPAELGALDTNRQRILYIEDNLSNLTLNERILQRQANVELISAMQGTLGLELARQHRPDLIVLDLHLPDMPGADVLKRLKADPVTREAPVVVLTADASARQSERVRQLGAPAYLTKPLDVPEFLKIVANHLQERDPRRRASRADLDTASRRAPPPSRRGARTCGGPDHEPASLGVCLLSTDSGRAPGRMPFACRSGLRTRSARRSITELARKADSRVRALGRRTLFSRAWAWAWA